MPSPVSAPGGGGPPFDPNNRRVLSLIGAYMHHVLLGVVYPNGPRDMGASMLSEMWLKPRPDGAGPLGGPSGGIAWVEGPGGAHVNSAVIATVPGSLSGNMWDGTQSVSYGSDNEWNGDEWGHACLVFNGDVSCQKLFVYKNGVCVGQVTLTARVALPWVNGNGTFTIGGVDHQCITAWVAYFGLYEYNASPFKPIYPIAFVPNRFPAPHGNHLVSGIPPGVIKDLHVDLITPGIALDLSPLGMAGELYPDRSHHHGIPEGFSGQITPRGDWEGYAGPGTDTPDPQWVEDNTCPYRRPYVANPVTGENIPAPRTAPVDANFFDSFGRRNQTWAHQQVPTLGQSEDGGRGLTRRTWVTGVVGPDVPNGLRGGSIWGILQAGKPDGVNLEGSAVFLDDAPSVAYVNIGTNRHDISSRRSLSPWGNGETGVCWWVVDKDNGWQAYYSPALGGIWVGFWVNGATGGFTHVDTFNPGATGWQDLRVTGVGSTINVYTDDLAGGWILRGTINSSQYNTATRFGICTPSLNLGSSLARYMRVTGRVI